ncbi:hypothetical protein VPNG_10093 [Cytospora leucostoma]|uniref:alpha-1,2-Mannosidase n=1 Tax=Cytospora leucostoma TaxID=1230097 RepID=A0A423VJ40_9PEZI|nr:hypothetical protein VPNG_10093 [Cytospora leucostoma]
MSPHSPRKGKKTWPSPPRSPFTGKTKPSHKNLFLTLLCTALIYLLYESHNPSRPEPESIRLERYMNTNPKDQTSGAPKSSFDWGSITFKYPPTGTPIPLPTGGPATLPRIQHPSFLTTPETPAAARTRSARRDEVRAVFSRAWQSYRRLAWGKDALLPVSGGATDQFYGWAATLVDTLDTLWIMGLREEFDEAVGAVAAIDFGASGLSQGRVNMFETNIRYLGGLLGAYDLSGRGVLLARAVEVGDMLYAGFNTANRMPVDFFDMRQSKLGAGLEVEEGVVSASPGTLLLEFTRLSQVTGDPKYYSAVAPIAELFRAGQNGTLLPGLWPQWVSMRRGDVVSGADFSIGSGADSLYEYIVKMHAMLGGREGSYAAMSEGWMDAADEHLLYRPMLPDGRDILLAGNAKVSPGGYEGQQGPVVSLDPESEHLSCFVGGVYALGGRLLSRDDYVDVGVKLTRGCAYAYRAMPTGMMPERFNMVACESRERCPWDQERWVEERRRRPEWMAHLPLGFTTAKDPRYILRPEAIESVFVLYRVTGRQEFQEMAWEMFRAVGNGTLTEFANAAVVDVTKADYPLEKVDYMESFWLAETLKYYYLALSPPDLISLDDFVLNTEAHPFRRPS